MLKNMNVGSKSGKKVKDKVTGKKSQEKKSQEESHNIYLWEKVPYMKERKSKYVFCIFQCNEMVTCM